MGNKNSGKRLYRVNDKFFSKWGPNMSYILGFTCADGNVHGRTLSWELSNKIKYNIDLLKSFNQTMDSNYPIEKRSFSYRLRISNSSILNDIVRLGVVPNKKKVLLFPDVPDKYLNHFIRGFLDGDGWVTAIIRRKDTKEISVGFSNGSYNFMKGLISRLRIKSSISNFNLRCREKKMKNGMLSKTYQLEFYSRNANNIMNFLYGNLSETDLFLKCKYEKYLKAQKFFDEMEKSKVVGRRWFRLERGRKINVKNLLSNSLLKNKIMPKDIANNLGISLSTLYRWLDKSGVRKFAKRGSSEWSSRIINSKRLVQNV